MRVPEEHGLAIYAVSRSDTRRLRARPRRIGHRKRGLDHRLYGRGRALLRVIAAEDAAEGRRAEGQDAAGLAMERDEARLAADAPPRAPMYAFAGS